MTLVHHPPHTPGAPATCAQEPYIVGALQQIQRVLEAHHPHATLLDAARLIQHLQAEYGEHAELEDIIQELVTRQLATQIAQRQAKKVLLCQ